MKDPTNKDSLFFFFDAKSHYLIKKEVTGIKNTKITHYKDYKKVDKIMFPFLEVSTIHIDGKIAQKSSNTINQIKINQDIPATEFE